jgi:hypothetical protein
MISSRCHGAMQLERRNGVIIEEQFWRPAVIPKRSFDLRDYTYHYDPRRKHAGSC